jgi:hypothetical protein
MIHFRGIGCLVSKTDCFYSHDGLVNTVNEFLGMIDTAFVLSCGSCVGLVRKTSIGRFDRKIEENTSYPTAELRIVIRVRLQPRVNYVDCLRVHTVCRACGRNFSILNFVGSTSNNPEI